MMLLTTQFGNRVYVANSKDNRISVIDVLTYDTIRDIKVRTKTIFQEYIFDMVNTLCDGQKHSVNHRYCK